MDNTPTDEELRRAYNLHKLSSWGSFEDTMANPIRRVAVIAIAKRMHRMAGSSSGEPRAGAGTSYPPPQRKTPQIERHTVDLKRLASGDKDDA